MARNTGDVALAGRLVMSRAHHRGHVGVSFETSSIDDVSVVRDRPVIAWFQIYYAQCQVVECCSQIHETQLDLVNGI
jgi:hypothetical protein